MFKPHLRSQVSAFRLLLVCGLWSLVGGLPLPASAQSRQPITLISGTTTAYVDTVILDGTGITSLTASNYLTGRRIATLTVTGGGTTGTDSNTVNALWFANAATGTVQNASTSTVAQTALAGWPTQWAWASITNPPAFLTAEADTLATVLSRGNTSVTQPAIQLGGQVLMVSHSGQLDLYDADGLFAYVTLSSVNGTLKLQSAGKDDISLSASNITALGRFIGRGSGLTGTGSTFTAGAALSGWPTTWPQYLATNDITIVQTTNSAGVASVSGGQISIGTNLPPSSASGGGITAFYWPHSRGVIPSGSGATRYGVDYQFTSFPTLTNSTLIFYSLPIVNTVSNLAVWSSAASGVATTTYAFAFAAYDGTTNAPSYTITNFVTAVSGASKVSSNCTTAITPGTYTMKMFPVSGSTNSLLSTVEGNIQ